MPKGGNLRGMSLGCQLFSSNVLNIVNTHRK